MPQGDLLELPGGACVDRASQVVLVVKKLAANAGGVRDVGSIPGLGRSPGQSLLTLSCFLCLPPFL